MHSIWLDDHSVAVRCQRHEAFWRGELDEGPLLWITVPNATSGTPPQEPSSEDALWTDVPYVLAKAEYDLGHTYYAGDALPVHHPWLGPDQFAAWLGAEMLLKPRDNTSWVQPSARDLEDYADIGLDPANRWWKLYLELVQASVERGRDKWITAYPDLHTGVDALCALRGPQQLMFDMIESPQLVHGAMARMTRLWQEVIDRVSDLVLPGRQGTSNWTMGYSAQRFACIGQNDFSALIGPKMFDDFCLADTVECAGHVDRTIYHLDGPGALKHLPRLLESERLDCIQWIQGAGQPLPSQWLDLLRRIQAAGKSVQVFYAGAHGGNADFQQEIEALCQGLDRRRLFVVIEAHSVEQADSLVRRYAASD